MIMPMTLISLPGLRYCAYGSWWGRADLHDLTYDVLKATVFEQVSDRLLTDPPWLTCFLDKHGQWRSFPAHPWSKLID